MRKYYEEPEDHRAFTEDFDRFYTRFAGAYDLLVKAFPLWKKWLRRAVSYLVGPRILEISFGTGWLMTQYADRFEVHGVDLNNRMAFSGYPDAQGALSEMVRVLKPTGRIVLIDVSYPNLDDSRATVANSIA